LSSTHCYLQPQVNVLSRLKQLCEEFCGNGHFLLTAGDMEEADIESARTADPTNPEPVRFKASVLVNRGAVPGAREVGVC